MNDLLTELQKLLSKDERLVSDDKLLKNKIVELAYKVDSDLIKLLLSNPKFKELFFQDIDGVFVFNQGKFQTFISNKEFLPNSFTSYKNKIGLTNKNGEFISQDKEVVLSFPYKDCVLEGGQDKEDAKRDEIFYNKILASDEIDRLSEPKVLTNFRKFDKDGVHKVDMIKEKDNLIIRGNNLLALNSLKKKYGKKIKLIYIDPPYNPNSVANTFMYNNSFNHSTWLTFVKNRADISKEILSDNGFFCIAIDHNELFYLGVLLDEIFGRENRVGIIAVETNPGGRSDSEFFATSHETFIVYAKDIKQAKINDLMMNSEELEKYKLEDKTSRYKLVPLRRTGSNSTPDKRPNLCFPIYFNTQNREISIEKKDGFIEILPEGDNSIMRVWRWSKTKILNSLADIEVKKSKGKYSVFVKDRIKFGKKPKTMWYGSQYDASSHGTKLLKKMKLDKLFNYPKSLYLLKDIIQVLTNKDDIILDYHAGSGTTGHATLVLNKEDGGDRKFILVEQMDYIETVTAKRIHEVIKQHKDGEFIRLDLMESNEHFINDIQNAKNLVEVLNKIKQNGFLTHKVDLAKLDKNEFIKLPEEEQRSLLIEILDANHLYVNLNDIEDARFKVSEEDKRLNKQFYSL